MDGYILDIIKKYRHLTPKKPQYLPHKQCTIDYGSKQLIVQPADNIQYLDDKGIQIFQVIVGVLLTVGRVLNKKLLVALSAVGYQQAAETIETEDAIKKLLDYVATYPDDDILFRKSDMILAAHIDT